MPFQLVTNEGKRISLLNGGDAARAGGYPRAGGYDQYPPQTGVGQAGGAYMPPPPPSLMDSTQYYTTSVPPPLYAGQQNPTPRTPTGPGSGTASGASGPGTSPPGAGAMSGGSGAGGPGAGSPTGNMYGMSQPSPMQNPYAYYYGSGPALYGGAGGAGAATLPPHLGGLYGAPGGPGPKDMGGPLDPTAAGPAVAPVSHVATKPVKKYTCHCMRSFTTSGHLARHMRIHTGEKNYKCPHEGCGARFSRQDNCMQHYRTHLGGRGRGNSRSNRGSGSGASGGGSRGSGAGGPGGARNNSASSQGSSNAAAGPGAVQANPGDQNTLQAFAGVASMQAVQ